MVDSQPKVSVGTSRKASRFTAQPTFWIVMALSAICVSLFTSSVLAVHPYEKWAQEFGLDMNVSYDGIRVMEMEGGQFEATERRAPGKMYMEMHIGGMSSGVILREDLQKSYLLMPSMGFYKEESLEGGLLQASNGMEFSKIEKMGHEDINGHASTKYKTQFKDNEGKGAGFVWVTDTGVPIKLDMIYSNKEFKGQRMTMQFTELNLRAQDPSYFELPANLKPMNFGNMGSLMQMGAQAPAGNNSAATPAAPATPATPATSAAPAASSGGDLAARQQACLEQASAQAAEQKKSSEKKKGFGRLLGSVSRISSRFGLGKMSEVTRDVYDANATAQDVEVIADELGITTDEVERCREPS